MYQKRITLQVAGMAVVLLFHPMVHACEDHATVLRSPEAEALPPPFCMARFTNDGNPEHRMTRLLSDWAGRINTLGIKQVMLLAYSNPLRKTPDALSVSAQMGSLVQRELYQMGVSEKGSVKIMNFGYELSAGKGKMQRGARVELVESLCMKMFPNATQAERWGH